jgi:hypothetical protein
MPADRYHSPIAPQLWDAIRDEFGLPALGQVRARLEASSPDPEPALRQLIRVFIDDGTFCPGFPFFPGGQLHPTVTALFRRSMELDIPHNYFTVWMVTPSRELGGTRPVDLLRNSHAPLLHALNAFGARLAQGS